MKKIILVLSITFIISTFSACNKSTVNESSSESATSKVVAVTTTSETEKVAETNAVTSETESQIETSHEYVSEKKLNLDLLSDIGLTYEEIKTKRGERVDAEGWQASMLYSFEYAQGSYYAWTLNDLDYGQELSSGDSFLLPRDESGELIIKDVPSPKANIKCLYILESKAKNLFLGLNCDVSTSEIEQMYPVKHKEDSWDAHDDSYESYFIYEENDIVINTKEKGVITPDSYLQISLTSNLN